MQEAVSQKLLIESDNIARLLVLSPMEGLTEASAILHITPAAAAIKVI